MASLSRASCCFSANDVSLLPEALWCFEKAMVLRRDLPLEENLWFRWGLSAGWMNRGDVLTPQSAVVRRRGFKVLAVLYSPNMPAGPASPPWLFAGTKCFLKRTADGEG